MALPSLQTNNQKKRRRLYVCLSISCTRQLSHKDSEQARLNFSFLFRSDQRRFLYILMTWWEEFKFYIFSIFLHNLSIFLFKNLLLHVSELCLIPFWQSSTNSLFLFFLTLDFGRHKLALRGLQRCWPLKLFLTPPCSVSDSITGHAGTELVSHSAAQHLRKASVITWTWCWNWSSETKWCKFLQRGPFIRFWRWKHILLEKPPKEVAV